MAEAARWYESHRAGLGVEFLDAVDSAVARIAETPRMGSLVPGISEETIRHRPVRRFPYHLCTWSWAIGSRFSRSRTTVAGLDTGWDGFPPDVRRAD
jgi:hypothetical protein